MGKVTVPPRRGGGLCKGWWWRWWVCRSLTCDGMGWSLARAHPPHSVPPFDMHLLPFVDGMHGPTWISPQGFVGALDYFLSRQVTPEVGTVRVESTSVFPSDHYHVRLHLHILRALSFPGNPTSRARFKLGTRGSELQRQDFATGYQALHSLPPAATAEAYQHFVTVLTSSAEAIFGPPCVPDTTPGSVSSAA